MAVPETMTIHAAIARIPILYSGTRCIFEIIAFGAGQVARLEGKLDPSDRGRLNEYLDGIREVERSIQKAMKQSATEISIPHAPVRIPAEPSRITSS